MGKLRIGQKENVVACGQRGRGAVTESSEQEGSIRSSGSAFDRCNDPRHTELPCMLDISPEPERSVQLHADEAHGPRGESAGSFERIVCTGQCASQLQDPFTCSGPKFGPSNRNPCSGRHDQLEGSGMLVAKRAEPARELHQIRSGIQLFGEIGQADRKSVV